MLLWVAEYLQQYSSFFAVFQYLTLRGILGVLTALAISLILGPWMIRKLNYLQIGQSVRDDGSAIPSDQIRYAHHGRYANIGGNFYQRPVLV